MEGRLEARWKIQRAVMGGCGQVKCKSASCAEKEVGKKVERLTERM